VAYFKTLSQHLLGGTEDNHVKSQTELQVTGSGFEPDISRIRGNRSKHCIMTYGGLVPWFSTVPSSPSHTNSYYWLTHILTDSLLF